MADGTIRVNPSKRITDRILKRLGAEVLLRRNVLSGTLFDGLGDRLRDGHPGARAARCTLVVGTDERAGAAAIG